MQRRTFSSLIVLLTLGIGLLPLRPAAAQAPTDAALIASIDALAAETLAHPGTAGLSVAVARGDRIILSKGYGKIDLELGVAATDASMFRIASVTKQFTAAAILRLAEQGKLALDDDFTQYVDYPTHGKTVTIRHLLTHLRHQELHRRRRLLRDRHRRGRHPWIQLHPRLLHPGEAVDRGHLEQPGRVRRPARGGDRARGLSHLGSGDPAHERTRGRRRDAPGPVAGRGTSSRSSPGSGRRARSRGRGSTATTTA